MARRYVRDNRGRFASVGATARGGRLRTAAGNKRATVAGKIEGAVPAGTIRPNRRSAQPQATTPVARLTPRQKARRLGALPQRQNQGPIRTSSIPKGTVGANAPTRNMTRVDRALKSVKLTHSSQMAVADIARGGGMIAGASPSQARRALMGRRTQISFVNPRSAYKGYVPPSLAEFTKRERAALTERRRAQKPRKRK